ncbi:hypothetical protein SUGI_0403210 [Cryptomeria japonica]|uniref:uncharacterized protein LOC131077392 n=1 Tax=Cryptomeria japonica TaxID=3369 RepID=UPI0024089BF2|nr:uncharacterized protein LOC131077392 [Cryptomeria japonica]GLJ21651.1 hypothetical protein SUGI_0403210 [Cryptomeria japonica]
MSGGVKEGAARAVLKDVWRQGHESVELRQDGKRVIFFCRLCSTRCYSDSALSDHLNGNLHAKRQALASCSSSSPSPSWPFNDGLVFLFPSSKTTTHIQLQQDNSNTNSSGSSNPFPLQWMGCGHVSMRILHSSIIPPQPPLVKAVAVWCCWLGETQEHAASTSTSTGNAKECEYAIVSFPYTHTLGRGSNGVGAAPNVKLQSSSSSSALGIERKKIRKKKGRPSKSNNHSHTLVEVEAAVEHRDMDLDREGEEEVGCSSNEGESLGRDLLKSMSNKALRRAFTRQRLKALERLCFICHQQMLPGKDVAALLNRKSGLIACSSRNRRGSFHVFHTSCLIDWILLCESKIWLSHFNGGKGPRRGRWSVLEQRRKPASKGSSSSSSSSCGSVFCPECQGTGLKTRAGQLEVPRYKLAQVFDWILELIQSRKSWIDHPEQLQECATGLLFCPADSSQGNVISMLLLHFYGFNGTEFGARCA